MSESTWGDPLTDALQADKAAGDDRVHRAEEQRDQARQAARFLMILVSRYCPNPVSLPFSVALQEVKAQMREWPESSSP